MSDLDAPTFLNTRPRYVMTKQTWPRLVVSIPAYLVAGVLGRGYTKLMNFGDAAIGRKEIPSEWDEKQGTISADLICSICRKNWHTCEHLDIEVK